MSVNEIFEILVKYTKEVVPSLQDHIFSLDDSMRELGANSVDRSEIIMLTLEELSLNLSLLKLSSAQNLGELATVIRENM
ncbi:acyl carrier protein [Gynuella sunshinyii]|uniref:Acyl carrier protein n=1 Tax=Gynuella sunshinyii YC6258 TaxID=1445510 RepID=A0A0C5VLC6_9GAMM|nr:acyl carrier protein [Gynuella sunshinyii]AJQ95106.1 hypothetical Protein YC6258_03070 [Gynuella sunshinyii YC6258]DAC80081.1 TPA_exp: acyl carrier protein [Gynuella sunshinyii YC6258]